MDTELLVAVESREQTARRAPAKISPSWRRTLLESQISVCAFAEAVQSIHPIRCKSSGARLTNAVNYV